jgi:glutamine synthetase
MAVTNSSKRLTDSELYVNHEARPGWQTGVHRIPTQGEEVYCASGPALVVRVLGKTGDGSRLLELRLPDPRAKPFFAAASNVLVAPAA